MGRTTGCARCHDHKFDPIPTRDFYSLLGVFKSTEVHKTHLVPESEVAGYDRLKKELDDQQTMIDDYVEKHSIELGEMLATKTARFLL